MPKSKSGSLEKFFANVNVVHPSQSAAYAARLVRTSVHSHHTRPLKLMNSTRVNEEIIVRLKWGQTEYKGRLISVDSYMNIQLSNTEELVDGKSGGTLGQVLIRYVRGDPQYRASTTHQLRVKSADK